MPTVKLSKLPRGRDSWSRAPYVRAIWESKLGDIALTQKPKSVEFGGSWTSLPLSSLKGELDKGLCGIRSINPFGLTKLKKKKKGRG